jgi:hypothetical protein
VYVFPQPSGTVPQFAPLAAQFFGWHSHLFATHASAAFPQSPQSSEAPQPSSTVPHVTPRSGHVFGVHAHLPLTQLPPPEHVPHSMAEPHPSSCVPQVKPWSLHDFRTQPFGVTSPPPPPSTPSTAAGSSRGASKSTPST